MGAESRTKETLLRAAESLLERDGPECVTTRAVCAVAKVTAPTLYHHFRDKNELFDGLVMRGLDAFMAVKGATPRTEDALADLLAGWDAFIRFSLDRPQLYRLMARRAGDNPRILAMALADTDARLERLRKEGRLRVDVALASRCLLAMSTGVAMLAARGVAREEVEGVGRFLVTTVLPAMVRLTDAEGPR